MGGKKARKLREQIRYVTKYLQLYRLCEFSFEMYLAVPRTV